MEPCTARTIPYLCYVKVMLRIDSNISPILLLHLHRNPISQTAQMQVFHRSTAFAKIDQGVMSGIGIEKAVSTML